MMPLGPTGPGKAARKAVSREPGDLPSQAVTRGRVGRGVPAGGSIPAIVRVQALGSQ